MVVVSVLFILIIIGISACTAGVTGNLGGNSSKEANKTHKIGETVKNGDLEVTVNSVAADEICRTVSCTNKR